MTANVTAPEAQTDGSSFARTSIIATLSYGIAAAAALVAGFLSVLAVPPWIVAALVVATLAWQIYGLWARRGRFGYCVVVRVVAAASVAMSFGPGSHPGSDPWTAIAAFVCLGAPIMLESILKRATDSRVTFVSNLPGVTAAGRMPKLDRPVVTSSAAAIALGSVVSLRDGPAWLWLVLAVAVVVFYLLVTFLAIRRIVTNSVLTRDLAGAVAEYQPEFLIYTSRPDDASYQILMWLPYLKRTGRRFIIVTRHATPAVALAQQTDAPVIARGGVAELEEILVDSLRAVFYVNASSGNASMVRYREFTHTYLGHGDSDKPPSYNPLHAMFDAIFAAGPAATRRYAEHGVTMDPEKFEVVGRPQLESVIRPDESISAIDSPTVLYAPTWRGHVDETMLYSLPQGPDIVEYLLQAGASVIFRPHPFSYQFDEDVEAIKKIHRILEDDRARTGRQHVFGSAAESDRDVIECINSSDAMISDVSSVVSDYLYSGKPFAMVAVSATGDDFLSQYPIAQAAYVLEADLSNVGELLDRLLRCDPLQGRRLELRADYLGDFPAEGYADHFIAAADRMITRTRRRAEVDRGDGELNVDNDVGTADADAGASADVDELEAPSGEDRSSSADDEDDESEAEPTNGSETLRPTLNRLRQKVAGRTLVPSGLSLAAFVGLLLSAPVAVVASIGILANGVHLFLNRRSIRGGRRPVGTLRVLNAARALLAATFGLAWTVSYGWSWLIAAASLLLVVTIAMESTLESAWRVTGLEARNLPGGKTSGYQPVDRGFVPIASSAVTTLCWIFSYFGTPAINPFLLALVPFALAVVLYRSGIERGVRSARLDLRLPELMADYGAEFAVYFGSNVGINYQLQMWLPYFKRMDRRFVVITRDIRMMRTAGRLTSAPVINRPTLRSLEDVITPSMKAAFYVNNAGLNTHFIERREMTHVWLNHGDSEKPACYNPVHGIYDYIFAAGQAGIDRYARHGVEIPAEKFEIVGRPQVEGIKRMRPGRGRREEKTVLYAPTWRGPYDDTRVYSLPHGRRIVEALLERGCTVIFRAHNLNYDFPDDRALIKDIKSLLAEDRQETGRQHAWGTRAEHRMSLTDCFNASDAMISDVSAVVTDYLQSDKPFSIVSVGRSVGELAEEAPASAAAYVIEDDLSNLDEAIDNMLGADPLSSERDRMRQYYLGNFNARHYADAFVDAAVGIIDKRAAADAEDAKAAEDAKVAEPC